MTITASNVFAVGGAVRDWLRSPTVEPHDLDFAVEASSFEAMERFVNQRAIKVFLVTPEFTTIRAQFPAGDPCLGPLGKLTRKPVVNADFVLCRKDGPTKDGRRPQFVQPGTLLDDLARRDFTVNAMALSSRGDLIDPHNGQSDLKCSTLRFVGNPEDRLAEDALRAFRAVRFGVTKELFMDAPTKRFINSMSDEQFAAVSTERIREELLRMAKEELSPGVFIEEFVIGFPTLFELAIRRGIWFQPTTEKK